MKSALALDVVARAESYPYGLDERKASVDLLPPGSVGPAPLARPIALVGIGAHAAQPLATLASPARTARLRDHAVVFAATLTTTGAVPATLLPVPGATALVPVNVVDEQTVASLHDEADADGDELLDVTGVLEVMQPAARRALAPCSRFGPLLVNGQPLRLAEVPTVGTRFGAAYQGGLLALLHRSCAAPGEPYAEFVHDLATSPERRVTVRRLLASGLRTRRSP